MFSASIETLVNGLDKNARLMGLDVGEKTIGLALSDALRSIASPLEVIERSKFSKDAEHLRMLCEKHKVGGFVVGYPINMNGTEGPRCQSTRQFCRNLHEKLGLPMLLQDERMSTIAVGRVMDDAELSRTRKSEIVDKLAASYILQSALDRYQRNSNHES